MSVEEYSQEMAQYDEAAADVEAPERKTIHHGWSGQAILKVCRLEKASWDPEVSQLFYLFEATDGAGTVAQWDTWESDAQFKFTVSRLKALGWKCKDDQPFSGVAQALADGFFEDLLVDAKVQWTEKKEHPGQFFINLWVNRTHGKAKEGVGHSAVRDDSDGIPF